MNATVAIVLLSTVALIGVGFVHPIGPALMLWVVTPFDAMFFGVFGQPGNLVTYVPVLIFLAKINPGRWGQIFFGTRVQQVAVLFVLALLVSHIASVDVLGPKIVLAYGRKVTLLLLLGIFAWCMSEPRHLALGAKVSVLAMALFSFLSMLDFYLGIQVLPLPVGYFDQGVLGVEYQSYLGNYYRFTGAGLATNRYGNYLILNIVLGLAWFGSAKNTLSRTVALGATVYLVICVLATVSRSSILGVASAAAIVMVMAFRFNPQQILGMALVSGVVVAGAWYGAQFMGSEEVIAQRFEVDKLAGSTSGRMLRWLTGVRIWMDDPLIGVGHGMFRRYSEAFIATGGTGSHNGYVLVLAETGLVGFLPLLGLLGVVLLRLLAPVKRAAPDLEYWRPFFLAAFVGMLVSNFFNDYLYERYLWMTIAFAVVLERVHGVARQQAAREKADGLSEDYAFGTAVSSRTP